MKNVSYFLCEDLISFFACKNEWIAKGYLYIENQKVDLSRAKNYVMIDHDICQFALCTRFEYELNNN